MFPDVKVVQITNDTEFLILACDGIWDVMTSQQAVDYVHKSCYGDSFVNNVRKKTLNELVKGVE